MVLDEFVKPYTRIIDYATRWSGITRRILDPVTTRIEQVQAALLTLVNSDTVVIGHSLENDLHALKFSHATCVDTSSMYASGRGPAYKPALRALSLEYLGRKIQQGKQGHSSEEDALATLQLATLKLRNGLEFGMRLNDSSSMRSILTAYASELKSSVIGDKATVTRHAFGSVNSVVVRPSKDTFQRLLAECQGDSQVIAAALSVHDVSYDPKVAFTSVGAALTQKLSTLAASMRPNSLLVVTTQPPVHAATKLSKRRKVCQDTRSTAKWSKEDEATLKAEVLASQLGQCLLFVQGGRGAAGGASTV